MSDRRQDDMAAQAWPGYVDILSATVIMFVFFVMVIVVVLYLYTIKFTETVQQQAERRIQETIQKKVETSESFTELEQKKSMAVQEIKELEEKKQDVKDELLALEKQVKQLESGFEDASKQSVIINDKELIVLYGNNSAKFNNDMIEKISKFFELHPGASKIDITAGDNPLAVTQSSERQSTLARMLNARNIALDAGFEANQITINYVKPKQIENNYNWVRIRID